MPDTQSYYTTLGISKTASDDEIKKAYRKNALKFHPDRNKEPGAEAQFKKVSEAFEVLSDTEKRKVYDQFGEEGLKGGGGQPGGAGGFPAGGFSSGGMPGGFSGFSSGGMPGGSSFKFSASDPNDIFSAFFGGGDPFASMGGGKGGGSMPGGFGGMGGMGGMGGIPGGFGSMGGGGSSRPRSAQAEAEVITKPLPISLEDLYTGTTKRLKISRKLLDNSGSQMAADKILEVKIKPGYKSGTKITFENAGDEKQDGTTQTIQFLIEDKPHPTLKREGDNLRTVVSIPLVEALTGYERAVQTIDGKTLRLSGSQPAQNGQVQRYPEQGMPNSKTGKRGDFLVEINVKMPASLTAQQKAELKRILT